ncbi:MAG: TetR/AcrR family transcriptional regulator [Thermoanaerobacteraceae bacterium]|nr:TetR/AcrR family transcriptional regulator [Thermoanaerobacteraceae bacterium]
MVKQGFLNLPDEEKQRIIDAALDEFAENDFFSASLNRIIQKAGISKGSMYHYFHDKEDLYLYVLQLGMEKKRKFLTAALAQLDKPVEEMGFFESLEFQLKVSIDFALENLRLHMLIENLEHCDNRQFRAKIMERLGGELENYMGALVDRAIESGELRNDLDRDFIMHLFRLIFISYTQLFPDARHPEKVGRDRLEQEMTQLVSFLKTGLQAREQNQRKGKNVMRGVEQLPDVSQRGSAETGANREVWISRELNE